MGLYGLFNLNVCIYLYKKLIFGSKPYLQFAKIVKIMVLRTQNSVNNKTVQSSLFHNKTNK